MKGLGDEEVEEAYDQSVCSFEQDKIIQGKIVNIIGDSAIIDVGYKSEGAVPLDQFDNASELSVGDEVEVLLEGLDDTTGMIMLSKRKADRIRGWEHILATKKEGDIITGRVRGFPTLPVPNGTRLIIIAPTATASGSTGPKAAPMRSPNRYGSAAAMRGTTASICFRQYSSAEATATGAAP